MKAVAETFKLLKFLLWILIGTAQPLGWGAIAPAIFNDRFKTLEILDVTLTDL